MESSMETEINQTDNSHQHDVRLSKRLAYLLRYGAEKEGLSVSEGGWVNLMELAKVPMMKWYTIYELMKEVINSRSYRGMCRYEKKHSNGTVYVRAVYGRKMERNPCHNGTQVGRLLNLCMDKICDDLDTYDLEDFPDEFLINSMIHKLRRQKRLNNKAFRSLLSTTIEHLDLGAVYLTEGTIKLVGQRCPNLKLLILKDCGYILTDTLIEWLLKRLKSLENLNMVNCHHLTDRTITALCKHCKNIQQLNISGIPSISQEAILKLLTIPEKLHHLDAFGNKNITAEGMSTIEQIAEEKKVTVILKGLQFSSLPQESDPLPAMTSITTNIINLQHSTKETVQGSTFQGHKMMVTSLDQAAAARFALMQEPQIAQADHFIYAYKIVHQNGEVECGHSDDGASKLILEEIETFKATNVFIGVSRIKNGGNIGPRRFEMVKNTAKKALDLQTEFEDP